jgi:RHS repeat-associated protein
MKHLRTSLTAASTLTAILFIAACGDDPTPDKPIAEASTEQDCSDSKDNDGDGVTDCEDLDCRVAGSSCELAPKLDRSVATTVWESAQFLFTGKDALQKDTSSKAFSKKRIAIVRGRVVDRAGEPLAGVRVSVAGHEEWGHTLSRADGFYDLAVNGGSQLLVQLSSDGYLAAERSVKPAWQSYGSVPTVGLIEETGPKVELKTGADGEQIALGEAVEDAFGKRQPLLVFPRDTTATAELPDGSEQELASFHVRLTEYPFEAPTAENASEPSRFAPGSTPTRGGLTYGIEASVEEARELGATEVRFSELVAIVVENFLGLPVGSPVPMGYYRRGRGQWQPENAGRVVEVLGVTDDEADIDADGDGDAEDHDALYEIGISHAERRQLAARYEPGTTLWHLPVTHFSPHLSTIPLVAPHNAPAPTATVATVRPLDEPTRRGPVLVERQALTQGFGVAAAPFSLVYQSDRTPGYRQGYHVELPVIGKKVPEGLRRVVAKLSVAGQTLSQELAPKADLTAPFDWDGKDAFGRLVQGQQRADVSVSYIYDGELRPSESFGRTSSVSVTATDSIFEAALTRDFPLTIGTWDAAGYGLGGFSIDALHALDPATQKIYFGWGDERSAQNIALVASRPAGEAKLGTPDGVTVAPDGSVLVTDDQQGMADLGRLLRISTEGEVTIVAGDAAEGEAADLVLGSPQGIAMRDDGTIVVSDFALDAVREIAPDGSFRTLIGPTDDDPVVEANLTELDGIALGQRGELFIVNGPQVLRFEGDDLTVFAGTGEAPASDDVISPEAAPATDVDLAEPSGLAVAPDGSVFISERAGNRVRRVDPNGSITTFAGTGVAGFSGDGLEALAAQLDGPRGLALSPDGSLYIADQNNNRIRRVTPDGTIQTVVGDGDASLSEGQLAEKIKLDRPDGIAFGEDGALYIAAIDSVYKVSPGLPPTPEDSKESSLVPATDGHTLYRFDSRGKHLETIDAVTGVTELTFHYDDAGLLESIADKHDLTTKVERGKDGDIEAIVSPFGQRTTFETNDTNQVIGIIDPLERKTTLEYQELDLLTNLVSPQGAETVFDYDDQGRLEKITDPTGYFEKYAGKRVGSAATVEATTAEGYLTSYGLAGAAGGLLERTLTPPTGAKLKWSDRVTTQNMVSADGTTVAAFFAADQAFGAQTLLPSNATITTPGGRTLEATFVESKQLDDAKNFLSATEWNNAAVIGDRVSETRYKRSDRSIVTTSPMGRRTTVLFDKLGRAVDAEAPGLGTVRREYDDQGRVTSVTATAGGETRTQTFAYSDNGFLAATTNARSDITAFERDIVGRLLGLTLPDKNRITQELDGDDNLLALTLPGDKTHDFLYQGVTSQLVATFPPTVEGEATSGFKVGETQYQYDKHQQLVEIQRSDGNNIGFNYNTTTGQLDTIKTSGITLTHSYDAFGRLERLSRSDGVTVSMEFDGPLPVSTEWTGGVQGKLTADYNEFLELETLTVNDASSVSFEYDLDGAVTRASGNGHAFEITRDDATGFVTGTTLGTVSTIYDYSGFGELSTLSANFQGKDAFSQTLQRDELGRVKSIKEVSGNTTLSLAYSYDSRGQLTEVDRDGVVTSYNYDENGNRVSISVDGIEILAAEYDAQDRIRAFGDVAFEQTAHGDVLRRSQGDSALELEYDGLGNLLTAVVSDAKASKTISYTVDGFGRRVGKQVGGKFTRGWLYRDALRPVSEVTAEGVFSHFAYASGAPGAPDFMLRAGVPFRFVKDHQGSVRFVVNATTGIVAQALEYDDFGKVTRDTAPGFQPFGFAGGLYDPDSALVRFGARDYDPFVGRWAAKDPIGFAGGGNVYAYCGGDPVNLVDPDGKNPVAAAAAILIFLGISGDTFVEGSGNKQLVIIGAEMLSGEVALRAMRTTHSLYATYSKGSWTSLSKGLQIRKFGNMWVKRVNPQASGLMRAWGQHSLRAQANALEKLGELAVPHSFRNGLLATAHAGGRPSLGTFARAWAQGSRRIGILNDIRPRNMGANGLVFDPAYDLVEKSVLVGGAILGPSAAVGAVWYWMQDE